MDGKAEFSPELRNNLVPDSLTELEHELELELGNELEIELKLEVELAELALKFFNRKNILYDKDLSEMKSTKVFSVFCYIKLLSWSLLFI